MRGFSLLFLLIAVFVLIQFFIYIFVADPLDPVIAAIIFVSFLACAIPSIYLLKPFESRDKLRERREKFRQRRDESDRDGDS